jgi:hypothetical protein
MRSAEMRCEICETTGPGTTLISDSQWGRATHEIMFLHIRFRRYGPWRSDAGWSECWLSHLLKMGAQRGDWLLRILLEQFCNPCTLRKLTMDEPSRLSSASSSMTGIENRCSSSDNRVPIHWYAMSTMCECK